MSESRTFVFPENGNSGGGTNGILAMLPALMQQRGVDPNILALMGNGNSRNGNGWGDDLFAILLLFILMGWGGMGGFGGARGGMMGNGQGGVVPFVQNDANTAVIMQAVQRNGYDIQSLATALNTSSDAVQAAINGLGMQICNIGNQMGMNTNQIVTAIMQAIMPSSRRSASAAARQTRTSPKWLREPAVRLQPDKHPGEHGQPEHARIA